MGGGGEMRRCSRENGRGGGAVSKAQSTDVNTHTPSSAGAQRENNRESLLISYRGG